TAANRRNDGGGGLNAPEDRTPEEKVRDRTGRHETGGAETDLVAPPPFQATSRVLVLDLIVTN
ncbi:hypothetical protein A2U01_0100664, partial [Trifolium medium]|nr:hypothetical protein [Trifolium medium]